MMEHKGLIIAIDGYSSTGKSIVSKILAASLGYTYIDTGAMYRMVTFRAMQKGILREGRVDDEGLKRELETMTFGFRRDDRGGYLSYLDGQNVEEEIRGLPVSNNVSLVAAIDYVREILVGKQQEMGRAGGVVMDGRDIGSMVFPNADAKFFLTAAAETRAHRRFDEMRAKGETVTYEEIKNNVLQRDRADSSRSVGPLLKTPDAIEIDTSEMTIEEVVGQMLTVIRERDASGD
jgi:cytidylate kinase